MNGELRRSLSVISFVCLAGLAGMLNPTAVAAQSGPAAFDTSRLPRVGGGKQVFASPATTLFTSPTAVGPTTEATRKLLATAGWQAYTMPHTAYATNPNMSNTMLKKGAQGLSVYIAVAPGLNNATSVQYAGIPLKVDLPFPKDGAAIEYDPHQGVLNCLTGEPLDKTLIFYRAALGKLGWSLWSVKLGDKQPADSGPGELTKNGAYAFYVKDGKKSLRLTLRHEKDKLRVNIEPYRMKLLQQAHQKMVDAEQCAKGPPVASAQPAAKPAPKPAPAEPKQSPVEEMADMMKMAQQMIQTANDQAAQAAKTAPPSAASDQVPQFRADSTVPIPLPETADGIDYKAEGGRLNYDSRSSVGALAAFYRAEMKKRGWRERRSVINKANMVVLHFSKAKEKLDLTIMKFGDHAKVSGTGSALAVVRQPKPPAVALRAAPAAAAQQAAPESVSTKGPPLSMPANASEVAYDKEEGTLKFYSTTGVKALTDFYKAELERQGWKESSPGFQNRMISILRYAKGDDGIEIRINKVGNTTNVEASGSFLKSAAAKNAPPSAADLQVEEAAGLPVPKGRESTESEKSPTRRVVRTELELKLATTLDFYRRELGKRQWTENKGAVVAADHAVVAFKSPEGPAVLKLGRRAGRTTVELTVKNPAQAAKMGLLPKPGQAKVVFGNIMESGATITIHKKRIKIGAGVGSKEPDGPKLDLPPGKYKVMLHLPGKPAQSEDLELAVDETWGVIVGPGGVLPLQVY